MEETGADNQLLGHDATNDEDGKPIITQFRANRSRCSTSKYQKTYCVSWEIHPDFKDWISRHPIDSNRASCKYCSTTLRAHKADLRKHVQSIKHRKNEEFCKTGQEKIYVPSSSKISVKTTKKLKSELIPGEGSCMVFEDTLGMLDAAGNFIPVGNTLPLPPTVIENADPIEDKNIQELIAKVKVSINKDLVRVLRKDKNLLKTLQEGQDFCAGDEGIQRLTRIFVGKLAQHYILESALDTWRTGRGSSIADEMAMQLQDVEEKMETYVLKVRNLKMQLEGESGRGPTGVSLDTVDLSGIHARSATINIMEH